MAKVILNVDYVNGSVLPDMKVKPFVKDVLEKSRERAEPIKVSIGADIMITAFRYYVKKMGLETGHVVINYKGEKLQELVIDSDGMSVYEPEDAGVLNQMLMELM